MRKLLLIVLLFGAIASYGQTTIKVSELPNVTTPLNGDEYLLMVQNNITRKGTPQQIVNLVTKNTVGLSNVDNTSDVAKPVSTAQQSALDLKVPTSRTINGQALTSNITITAGDLSAVPTTRTVNGHALSANVSVTASDVGLGNVDNTSDVNKPVSTATSTALAGKVSTTVTVNGHALSSNVTVTATDLSLGNVNNTSDANKPISTATQTALDGKQTLDSDLTTIANIGSANQQIRVNGSGTAAEWFTPGGENPYTITAKTTDYTTTIGDYTSRNLIQANSSSPITFSIPTNATVPYPVGTRLSFQRIGTGTLSIAGAGGVTVTGSAGNLIDPGQYVIFVAVQTAPDVWIVQNGAAGGYQNWTPTFTGVSGGTYTCRYQVVGKTLFLWILWTAHGTGSGTADPTMTIPYTSYNGSVQRGLISTRNQATSAVGLYVPQSNSNIVTISRDVSGAAWTDAQNRSWSGCMQIEIQ